MLYLYDALHVLYVPVRVTRRALVAYRYTYDPPRCRTFIPLPVYLWNDFADHSFDGEGLAGFKSRANAFFIGLAVRSHFCLLRFPLSLLSFCILLLWGWGLGTDMV